MESVGEVSVVAPGSPASVGSNYTMENISEPGVNDVLCGRGGGTNNHIGNRRFRMLVNEHKPRYFAAGKLDKPKVAREVMIMWRKQEPPGRFLIKDATSKLWSDVGDQKAREKASQCLRERRTPCDVMPFRMPAGQSTSSANGGPLGGGNVLCHPGASMMGSNTNGYVPSVQDVEEAANAGIGLSHAFGDLDEYGGEDFVPPLPGGSNGFGNGNQDLMRDQLQNEMIAQQEQLILLQQQQLQMEQLHIHQQQLAQMSPDMTSEALQRHEDILHNMQFELKRQQDELEKQQNALLESMQATAQIISPEAHLIGSESRNLSRTGESSRCSKSIITPPPSSSRDIDYSRSSNKKKRTANDEVKTSSRSGGNIQDSSISSLRRSAKHNPMHGSGGHQGYQRMMACPLDMDDPHDPSEYDQQHASDMVKERNDLAAQKVRSNQEFRDSMQRYSNNSHHQLDNHHDHSGSMKARSNPRAMMALMKQQNRSTKSMEFEDLKEWASISSRHLNDDEDKPVKAKSSSRTDRRHHHGQDTGQDGDEAHVAFAPDKPLSSNGDHDRQSTYSRLSDERSSVMDWKSMRSVTSSKLEQTLENLAHEISDPNDHDHDDVEDSFRAMMEVPPLGDAFQDVIAPLGSSSHHHHNKSGGGNNNSRHHHHHDELSWAEKRHSRANNNNNGGGGQGGGNNNMRRAKMKNMKATGTGTSTISMMSELTDLSADMHALDLAIDD